MTDPNAVIDATVQRLAPELRDLVEQLHAEPELGYAEHKSVARIATLLQAHGHVPDVGSFGLPTSFVVSSGVEPRPHFALLAEYDALPGLGHACGHNVIAAISVGAYLAACAAHQGPGRISLIGTPAEEGGAGKEFIRRAGGLAGVDAAMLVHPEDNDSVFSATSGLRELRATFTGRAAHAAGAPHQGRNALDAVVTAYQSIAQLRQHLPAGQRVHGIITDGGTSPNVVPARSEGVFLVRSSDLDGLYDLSERVTAIFDAAALATGCTVELNWDERPPYLPLNVNESLGERYAAALARLGRPAPTQPHALRAVGPASDVGNLSYDVAVVQPTVAITPPGVANHTEAFAEWTISDRALDATLLAARALASTVVEFLSADSLRAAVASELAASPRLPQHLVANSQEFSRD